MAIKFRNAIEEGFGIIQKLLVLGFETRTGISDWIEATESLSQSQTQTSMPDRPNLKQFGQLMPDDVVTHPVWVSCHIVDYDEPWYDDTDEETFRPWQSEIPVAADEMYLVACEFTLADGSRHQGFATPALEPNEMGLIQPQIFSPSGKRHAFWQGVFPRQEEITGFYTDFAKGPSSVFPVSFSACRD